MVPVLSSDSNRLPKVPSTSPGENVSCGHWAREAIAACAGGLKTMHHGKTYGEMQVTM